MAWEKREKETNKGKKGGGKGMLDLARHLTVVNTLQSDGTVVNTLQSALQQVLTIYMA